ncbi:Origin of replication complex subunit 6 [Coemansia sp. RSA 2705]|nr:Origin of replication complex subunit 6 [Coemansia sp. RSA 2705]
MSAILAECISKLQLEDVPGLTPKAAQFFDQIGQRLSRSKNSALALCRQAVAVQLACESMSVEFNEAAACSLSSVSTSDFRSCVKDVRTSLGLVKHITLEELDVQHGPPQGIIESARRLLDEFKLRLSATMPAAVSRSTNWEDSVYIAGAFFLVCRQLKKRVVAKPTLVAAAGVKPAIFNSAVAKLEQFGSETLKAIAAGGIGALKTPSRKRVRETHEGDAENTPKSAARSRAKSRTPAAQTTFIQISDELGDIDSVARKRARRTASVRQPATEPVKRTNPTRRQAPQLGTPPTFATATVPDGPGDTPVPVRRKRGRPPMSAAQIAAKSEAAAKTAAAAVRRKKAEAASRLRFGIIGMVQDRDYRDTAQYASYQDWKASILKAK